MLIKKNYNIYTRQPEIKKMGSDTIYKYLGLGVTILIFAYIVIKTLNFQVKMVEGFTDNFGNSDAINANTNITNTTNTTKTSKENIAPAVAANTAAIDDPLLVSKYRTNYTDIIIDLDTNASAYILSSIVNNAEKISKDMGSKAAQEVLKSINEAVAFRKSLLDAVNILQNHK